MGRCGNGVVGYLVGDVAKLERRVDLCAGEARPDKRSAACGDSNGGATRYVRRVCGFMQAAIDYEYPSNHRMR